MSQAPPSANGSAPLPEVTGYRFLRVLGGGGMSTVYLAEQPSLSRQLAIKVMLPEALADEVGRKRFENEARTIARLEHPHIVGIFEVGRTSEGLPYYSMPLLPGGHLGQRILSPNRQLMDHAQVREILHALLSALGYAHARGVIHRDVKAENVMFDESGRPLLTDFGIALRRGYGTRVTSAGLAVGSTAYMAPEQARGEEVDQRADLYAVGVLAWEMLTGELPYNAGDAVSMAIKHVKDPIPRLPLHLRHWQPFVDRALAKTAGKRFNDAGQMLHELDKVRQRADSRTFAALPMLHASVEQARRMPVAGWLAVVLAAAAVGGFFLRGQQGATDFYRAKTGNAPNTAPIEDDRFALPAPVAQAFDNPADALLRAAPTSAAEGHIADADAQIRKQQFTSPAGDNAYESLIAAHAGDPTYLGLPAAIGRFIHATEATAIADIKRGNNDHASQLLDGASRLASTTGQSGSVAMADLRKHVVQALLQRIDKAAAEYDQPAAMSVIEDATSLGVSNADIARLKEHAERIPQTGDTIGTLPGNMVLVRNGGASIAADKMPVSRDDYARFAAATGREPALCRERASLLRVLAPRDWSSPGFEQTGSQPVVCVSWKDAEAYAAWLGARSGKHYRLPQAREAALLPSGDAGKKVAEWNSDCRGGCGTRMTSGKSWRSATSGRPLDIERGYDDVGFRLVTDLRDAKPR